tara:strand:+ start:7035 stop:7376 length:342 start_codon:yes stop_codon:yes gene_type:complete
MTKCFEFKLQLPEKTIKTFVYSDTGKDIESRFPGYKVSNIKEIEDPVSEKNLFKNTKKKECSAHTKDKEDKGECCKEESKEPKKPKVLKEDGTELTIEDLDVEVQELFKGKDK